MLYVIYGTDTNKVRTKLTTLTDALREKRPDAPVVRIKPESWHPSFLDETLSSTALFAPKSIIVLDSLVYYPDSADAMVASLDGIASSEHICIIVEEKIKAPELKKIEKKAEKIQEFNLVKEGDKKQPPQTFAFADAVASKDKKKAWMYFQSLVDKSVASEEIHGVLWWQFKSMMMALRYPNAKEAGLNPYVYSKCSGFAKKWGELELKTMLEKLVKMYHEAHRGEVDFGVELEKLCL